MTKQEKCDYFLGSLKAAIYVCSICKQIIWPNVTVDMDGVNIESENCSVTGGRKNIVLQRDICKDCAKKMML